jgi:hypothetical protein
MAPRNISLYFEIFRNLHQKIRPYGDLDLSQRRFIVYLQQISVKIATLMTIAETWQGEKDG